MKEKKNYLIDMDGVLVHGKNMIPGADDFNNRLIEEKRKFLILTNNPLYTTRDLAHRPQVTGLNILRRSCIPPRLLRLLSSIISAQKAPRMSLVSLV